MTRTDRLIEAALEDALLTLDDLCRVGTVSPQWVRQRIEEGLLPAPGRDPATWRFDVVTLTRVRHMVRIERDFDAPPELAALVADLSEEIAALRAKLRRAGLE
jgi:chaperone modulatory protein CbpM